MTKNFSKLLLIMGCGLVLAACSTTDKTQALLNVPAEQLYQDAQEALRNKEWGTARTNLKAIQNFYPYSNYAQQALIDQAYINWKDDEVKQALVDIDNFLTLYPSNPNADYMLYLKGLITFTSAGNFLTSWVGQDPSERDPKGLRESYIAFNTLVTQFPNSKYAPDSHTRMKWLVQTLADHDAGVAEYYYKKNDYVAAINRAQDVLKNYSGVRASEKALYILILSYRKLGLKEMEENAQAVFNQNFPNSVFPQQGLDKQRSFWDYFKPSSWFNN
ncbi:outer membrane protein assembly factor BamD [Basilea psittacipulmonis]|uniref:Outer membrane protein assembly factor BamD n=1 Tax=Basilea psittacipulmonis DSM 24701 TaxID=1072685 RepID=A0A077DC82_9BURK|nr:outer membrane protein assembly factor BamD [Basilea psittacipulmonis]AIL32224.1 competence protein ComL [Basilea psittacipulmonis DSM 24701]